jgi:hypothetical protein
VITERDRSGRSIAAITIDRLGRRLVLRSDIAAFNPEIPLAVDADEHARARHFGGIVDRGTLLECGERSLDLAEALVDLLREVVGLGVFLLEAVKLCPQGLAAGMFLVSEIHGLPIEST